MVNLHGDGSCRGLHNVCAAMHVALEMRWRPGEDRVKIEMQMCSALQKRRDKTCTADGDGRSRWRWTTYHCGDAMQSRWRQHKTIPKIIPKSHQNHTKIIPKPHQNTTKHNKSRQNHTKIIPKSHQTHTDSFGCYWTHFWPQPAVQKRGD